MIYVGFGLISKRIRSRSCFGPSIELVSALVRFNPKGKTPGVIRVRDELDRAAILGSAMPSSLGQPVACQAAHGGIPLGRYVGYTQGREAKPGWASEGVSAHGQ
jgi:hypothetical protein